MKIQLQSFLLFVGLCVFAGCIDSTPTKLFVITSKQYHDTFPYYQYRDADGDLEGFYERDTIYFIGDTIK